MRCKPHRESVRFLRRPRGIFRESGGCVHISPSKAWVIRDKHVYVTVREDEHCVDCHVASKLRGTKALIQGPAIAIWRALRS